MSTINIKLKNFSKIPVIHFEKKISNLKNCLETKRINLKELEYKKLLQNQNSTKNNFEKIKFIEISKNCYSDNSYNSKESTITQNKNIEKKENNNENEIIKSEKYKESKKCQTTSDYIKSNKKFLSKHLYIKTEKIDQLKFLKTKSYIEKLNRRKQNSIGIINDPLIIDSCTQKPEFENCLFKSKLCNYFKRNKNNVKVHNKNLVLNIVENDYKKFKIKNRNIFNNLNAIGVKNYLNSKNKLSPPKINLYLQNFKKELIQNRNSLNKKENTNVHILTRYNSWNNIFCNTIKTVTLPKFRDLSKAKNIFNCKSVYFASVN